MQPLFDHDHQAAISALFRVVNRYVGNLAPMPGVFPDYKAPIVRNGSEGRELATARWGMPSSAHALMEATKRRAAKLEAKGKPVDFKELLRMEPDGGTTNIRNVKSKHWTRWLGVENRCVYLSTVSANSTVACLFGAPEGRYFPAPWSPMEIARYVYALDYPGRPTRVSAFPNNISCHARSEVIGADRSKHELLALLKSFDPDTTLSGRQLCARSGRSPRK